MADSSFDIVSKIDRQEVDNALGQTAREIATRFDFKGTGATIEWQGDEAIEISASADDRATAVLDVFKSKLIKALGWTSYQWSVLVTDYRDTDGGTGYACVTFDTTVDAALAQSFFEHAASRTPSPTTRRRRRSSARSCTTTCSNSGSRRSTRWSAPCARII